jgi:hypothetical protein
MILIYWSYERFYSQISLSVAPPVYLQRTLELPKRQLIRELDLHLLVLFLESYLESGFCKSTALLKKTLGQRIGLRPAD